jgi:hypothetical protein
VTDDHKELSPVGYRQLATRPVLAWATVALFARVPTAMAALAMVFLCRDLPGNYALGGTLAAVYVVGEVVGSALLGTMLRPERMRIQLAVGLGVGAAAFGAAAARPPAAVLVVLAFLAGAAPAGSPGGLRSMLTAAVGESAVASAFSADAVLTEVVWMAAPALVVLLSLQVSSTAPMLLAAVCMGLAALGVLLLDPGETDEPSADRPATGTSRARLLLRGWPVYLTSAAAMSLMAVSELVLPALLEYRRIPVGYSGALLSGLAAVSALGAFLYGTRTWPGSVRTQSLGFLFATVVGVTVIALAPSLPVIAVCFAVAGLFQSIVMVTRNLSLRQHLAKDLHAAGYSWMYAVQGAGYSVSAVLAAAMLARHNPVGAIFVGVVLTVLLGGVSALAEVRRPVSVSPVEERVTVR